MTRRAEDLVISLERISKSYRSGPTEQQVLRDVNLRVYAGEVVVLLGRSGSGKSTLLNLISGIDLPDQGQVKVRDIDVGGANDLERTLFRRQHIGYVFQDFNLIPNLTVFENMALPLELNGLTDNLEARVRDLCGQLGIIDKVNHSPDQLSGGEQQRVAIGRALIHDPAVVLADEPTGALDLETGRAVLAVMDSLVRSFGKTMIMVTHSPEVIGDTDRILSIRDGALTEGTT